MKIKGFTLAEVLIALAVIGVISAVTVPVLMKNTNKQEYVSALKKTYSTLSQVTNQIIAEEGSPFGEGGWADTTENVYLLYKKHLNTAKDCGTSGLCFHSFKYLNTNRYDGKWGNYGLILADGVQVVFTPNASIAVDLNGEKKPNMWGRDGFTFYLTNNGLMPRNCSSANAECPGTDPTNMGKGCACKVLREGAMNY